MVAASSAFTLSLLRTREEKELCDLTVAESSAFTLSPHCKRVQLSLCDLNVADSLCDLNVAESSTFTLSLHCTREFHFHFVTSLYLPLSTILLSHFERVDLGRFSSQCQTLASIRSRMRTTTFLGIFMSIILHKKSAVDIDDTKNTAYHCSGIIYNSLRLRRCNIKSAKRCSHILSVYVAGKGETASLVFQH